MYIIIHEIETNAESITQDTVLDQLSKQIILPEEDPTSMMRIQDSKSLIKQDIFYKNIDNGDYIIVFSNLVLIYDFDKKLIKNIKTY
jgi:hypothetical protein